MRSGLAPLLGSPLLLLLSAAPVQATSNVTPPTVSPSEIHSFLEDMRDTPSGLPADTPEWTMWNPSQAACYDPMRDNLVVTLYNECLIEAGKALDEFADPIRALGATDWLGFLDFIPQSVEAVGVVGGLPVDLYRCKARAEIVAQLKASGAPQSEIEKARRNVDNVFSIAALLKLMAGFPTRSSDLGDWFDAIGGLSKSRSLFQQLADVFYTEVDILERDLTRVELRLDECRTDDFLDLAADLHRASIAYLVQSRKIVAEHEQSVYCDAVNSWLGGTAREKVEWARWHGQLKEAHTTQQDAAAEVIKIEDELERLNRLAGEKLREQLEVREQIEALYDTLSVALDACDVGGVRQVLAELQKLAGNACVSAIGEMRSLRREVHDLELMLEEYDKASGELQGFRSEIEGMLGTCSFQAASDRLQDLAHSLGSWESSIRIDLSQCPPPFEPWRPGNAYRERVSEGRRALADAKVEARALLQQAAEQNQQCNFERAWELIDGARNVLGAAGCTVNALNCEAETFDADLCSLAKLEEQRSALEGEISSRHQEYEAGMAETGQIAAELQAWGDQQLEIARSTSPERCNAIAQIPSIASDLEGLGAPLDCPGESPWTEAATELRRQLEEAVAAFDRRLAELAQAGEAAADACDTEAVESAIQELTGLEAAACPPRSDLSARLQQRLVDLKSEVTDARLVLRAGQAEWSRWGQTCDMSVLDEIDSWYTGFPHCGLELLDIEEQGRATFLINWEELAPSIRGQVNAPSLDIKRAEVLIKAAKRRIATGLADEQERRAVQLNLDRARDALQAARQAVAAMEGNAWIPSTCRQLMLDRIAAVEATIPTVPSVDGSSDTAGDPDEGLITSSPPVIQEAAVARSSGATVETRTATMSPAVSELASVHVPRLIGQSEALAVSWLQELELTPVLRQGDAASDPAEVAKVANQSPAADAVVSPGAAVTLWISGPVAPAAAAQPAPTAPSPVVTQAYCDSNWPGTVLVQQVPGGPAECRCPTGSGWSEVHGRCLSLAADGLAGGGAGVDCSARPGTLFDSASGQCRCPVGQWDPTQRRCVDTAAADRQRRVEQGQQAAECERLYSDIQVFRQNPIALYQQMAASAERKARAMGCDAARIAQAVAAGGRIVGPVPSGGRTGGPTGGGTPSGTGSGGPSSGGTGSTCSVTNFSLAHAATGAPLAYLVVRLDPTDPRSPVKEGYGVLTVPTRISRHNRVACSSARACLTLIFPEIPYRVLAEYRSSADAHAHVKRLCPNPWHVGNWGG